MAAAFKAMIMTLGLLVAVLMVLEGVAWWLHSTGTVKDFPGTPLRGQFSTLMDTPQPIAHFRSALI
jgi:high-affinity Fe2+/Pb2+ permease